MSTARALSTDSHDTSTLAVLWDMDGTLIESQPLWNASFTRLCEERGGTVSRAVLAALAGASEPGTRALIAATGAAAYAEDPVAYEITDAMNAEVGDLVVVQPPPLDVVGECVAQPGSPRRRRAETAAPACWAASSMMEDRRTPRVTGSPCHSSIASPRSSSVRPTTYSRARA